jgi:hypothetical protein
MRIISFSRKKEITCFYLAKRTEIEIRSINILLLFLDYAITYYFVFKYLNYILYYI